MDGVTELHATLRTYTCTYRSPPQCADRSSGVGAVNEASKPPTEAVGAGARAGEMYSPLHSARWVYAYGCRALGYGVLGNFPLSISHVIVYIWQSPYILYEAINWCTKDAGMVRGP
jgi:hypothetical protein